MRCTNCGYESPPGKTECDSCGMAFKSTPLPHVHSPEIVDQHTSPYPYVISIKKLVIMSVTTFGLYNVYWFYRHWKSIKAEKKVNINAYLRALFTLFMAYFLFKDVSKMVEAIPHIRKVRYDELTVVFIIFFVFSRLPYPFWLLGLLGVIPLIPIQQALNQYWEHTFGTRVLQSKFGIGNYIAMALGSFYFILIVVVPLYYSTLYRNMDFKQIAMSSCSTKDKQNGFCSCVIDNVTTKYNETQIDLMMAEYLHTETMPTAFTEAYKTCLPLKKE